MLRMPGPVLVNHPRGIVHCGECYTVVCYVYVSNVVLMVWAAF